MTQQLPRYRALANHLRQDIETGVLKPGDALPTELELCATHKLSRHTTREALRLLSEEGLIARKRGIGTIVTNTKAPAFAQSIGDFESLLQYAHETVLTLHAAMEAPDEFLQRQGLSGDFVIFIGQRRATNAAPVALTHIYVQAPMAPSLEIAQGLPGSFSEWLEETHNVAINSVTQRMEAVALSLDDAKQFGVLPGSAALRTVRRYRDADDRILLLSESLHPAGRFAYEMRLTRKRR